MKKPQLKYCLKYSLLDDSFCVPSLKAFSMLDNP